jgi:Zn-dependent metalloprotease
LQNRERENISEWDWRIGVPATTGKQGFPVRDLSDPPRYEQPDHMEDYVLTEEDQGGVHINNGIHNKAAYNFTNTESYLHTPDL